ncbi:uncharacterized protein MONBRDRAFT_24229 [Monosiga brevicollis MX1]|uniref:Uncharacterized protein n=1 Tax=Monosiga brevicollis TaxID=81824 RepID=A9UVS8_MONBE|nr:uncharacterized protein MONBRDRAFT_24229 [Monosiga brevicollis MX1]EDQ90444.1 predicted protein [Monosiga brevicollis MX1]|eukprot:XP_001744495.1 hypothetical protein [Monosiga brevicollis MX1]
MATRVAQLVSGNLKRKNRYNMLLLGKKSIGKTVLLHELCRVCPAVLGERLDRRLKVLMLNVGDLPEKAGVENGLFYLLAKPLGCPLEDGVWADSTSDEMAELLENHLKQRKEVLALFLDELQDVYTEKFSDKASRRFLADLTCLVGRDEGCFYVVATGSSRYLRALAFCQMDVRQAQDQGFKRYKQAFNLNSHKIQPQWMQPILDASDFLTFMTRHNPLTSVLSTYVSSSGLPGLMASAMDDASAGELAYNAGAKDEAKCDELVRLSNVVCADATFYVSDNLDSGSNSDGGDCDGNLDTAVLVEGRRAVQALAGALRFMPLQLLYGRESYVLERWYTLADRGLIRMQYSPTNRLMVAFGSYQVYHDVCAARDGPSVSAAEVGHLLARNENAEAIALRILGMRAKTWLGFDVLNENADVHPLPKRALVDELNGILFKDSAIKGKDSYGSDGVIFQRDGDDVLVHCMQLKLGTRELKQDDAMAVLRRWQTTAVSSPNVSFTKGELPKALAATKGVTDPYGWSGELLASIYRIKENFSQVLGPRQGSTSDPTAPSDGDAPQGPTTATGGPQVALNKIFHHIANNTVPESSRHALCSINYTILEKANGKFRPVGTDSIFNKVVNRALLEQQQPHIAHLLQASPELAVGVKDGISAAVGMAFGELQACESTPGWTMLSLDFKSAFNYTDRARLHEIVADKVPGLLRAFICSPSVLPDAVRETANTRMTVLGTPIGRREWMKKQLNDKAKHIAGKLNDMLTTGVSLQALLTAMHPRSFAQVAAAMPAAATATSLAPVTEDLSASVPSEPNGSGEQQPSPKSIGQTHHSIPNTPSDFLTMSSDESDSPPRSTALRAPTPIAPPAHHGDGDTNGSATPEPLVQSPTPAQMVLPDPSGTQQTHSDPSPPSASPPATAILPAAVSHPVEHSEHTNSAPLGEVSESETHNTAGEHSESEQDVLLSDPAPPNAANVLDAQRKVLLKTSGHRQLLACPFGLCKCKGPRLDRKAWVNHVLREHPYDEQATDLVKQVMEAKLVAQCNKCHLFFEATGISQHRSRCGANLKRATEALFHAAGHDLLEIMRGAWPQQCVGSRISVCELLKLARHPLMQRSRYPSNATETKLMAATLSQLYWSAVHSDYTAEEREMCWALILALPSMLLSAPSTALSTIDLRNMFHDRLRWLVTGQLGRVVDAMRKAPLWRCLPALVVVLYDFCFYVRDSSRLYLLA